MHNDVDLRDVYYVLLRIEEKLTALIASTVQESVRAEAFPAAATEASAAPAPTGGISPPSLDLSDPQWEKIAKETLQPAPAPKCAKCLDRGEYLLWIERVGSHPGNQLVRCEICQPPTSPAPAPNSSHLCTALRTLKDYANYANLCATLDQDETLAILAELDRLRAKAGEEKP